MHPDFSAAIKQPAAFQKHYYSAGYQIKYDGPKHVYFLTFQD
jgi:hypothetical protein